MIDFIAREMFRTTMIALVAFFASCAAHTAVIANRECCARPAPPAAPVPLSAWRVETGTCSDYRFEPALFCGKTAAPHYDGCRWYCVERGPRIRTLMICDGNGSCLHFGREVPRQPQFRDLQILDGKTSDLLQFNVKVQR